MLENSTPIKEIRHALVLAISFAIMAIAAMVAKNHLGADIKTPPEGSEVKEVKTVKNQATKILKNYPSPR